MAERNPKPWYLERGEDARRERVRRGLETEDGDVLALATWEVEREKRLVSGDIEDSDHGSEDASVRAETDG